MVSEQIFLFPFFHSPDYLLSISACFAYVGLQWRWADDLRAGGVCEEVLRCKTLPGDQGLSYQALLCGVVVFLILFLVSDLGPVLTSLLVTTLHTSSGTCSTFLISDLGNPCDCIYLTLL